MKNIIVQAVFFAGLAVSTLAADGLHPANLTAGSAGSANIGADADGDNGATVDVGAGGDVDTGIGGQRPGGPLFSTNTTPIGPDFTPSDAEATALNL